MKQNKPVVCADGFKMSVQAGEANYCEPRIDNAERYTEVEIGYPSREEDLLLKWAEEPDAPTNTVYGFVPVARVALVIAKHGGMVEGEVPPGVAPLKAKPTVPVQDIRFLANDPVEW
tara:strand:+ start:179 stop:529 length:351 start_codon:yes stop_codon:yes gene_type:complete